MKRINLLKVATFVALFGVLMTSADAQCNQRSKFKGECKPMACLNLTDSQKEEIKSLKVSLAKEMTPIKNELGIKMAELKAASTGDNVDSKAVYKLIDEISDLKSEIAKKHFSNKQKVRNLLTDEQKVKFDSRAGKGHRGGHHGKGMRHGRHDMRGKHHMKGNRGGGQGFGSIELSEDVEIIG